MQQRYTRDSKFRVIAQSAGRWMQGAILTAQQIHEGGFDLAHWLDVKAVEPADRAAPRIPREFKAR